MLVYYNTYGILAYPIYLIERHSAYSGAALFKKS